MLLLNTEGLNCYHYAMFVECWFTWFSGFAKTFCTNSSISTFNLISSFLACWLLLISSAVFIVMSSRPLLASMSAVLSNLALFSGTWNCNEDDHHQSQWLSVQWLTSLLQSPYFGLFSPGKRSGCPVSLGLQKLSISFCLEDKEFSQIHFLPRLSKARWLSCILFVL